METVVAPVARDDIGTFRAILAIYQEAIERSEQKAPDAVAELLRDERYAFLVSRTAGVESGFSISYFPRGGTFWLLEYMAVARDLRSKGVGAALLRETLAMGFERSGGAICVLEVDQPGGQVSPTNDPRRRLAFYARHGCRRIAGLSYVLPMDVAGKPPPMQLLVQGQPAPDRVSRDVVGEWLVALYQQVYGCAPDDPRIAEMLQPLPPVVDIVPLC